MNSGRATRADELNFHILIYFTSPFCLPLLEYPPCQQTDYQLNCCSPVSCLKGVCSCSIGTATTTESLAVLLNLMSRASCEVIYIQLGVSECSKDNIAK
jgi:hypothetical protein